MRRALSSALVASILATALPASTLAHSLKPLIKGEEVGYFGGATITHRVSVFVYSALGPSAGNRVTVCLRGKCERARGHDARLAWYSASFETRGLQMGQPLRLTVLASTPTRQARVRVTMPLLCMRNNGSTPQN